MGSNLRAGSLCAEYRAPDADSTRDMMSDGVTSDCVRGSDCGDKEDAVTDLVARTDDDMRPAEEAGDGGGVCVE